MKNAPEAAARLWIPIWQGNPVVRQDGQSIAWLKGSDIGSLEFDHDRAEPAGTVGTNQVMAVPLLGPPSPPYQAQPLRSLWGVTSEEAWAAAGRAVQLVEWADTHRYCGRCGGATRRADDDRSMLCEPCGRSYYPRIAPAVIVLVRRGAQALLAHGARFPLPFFSTLAGFSEIGETLEETVAREVREEVGIEIGNIRYFGSQPWPFPHSLMIGFTAEWTSGDLAPDGREILEARWFDAGALPLLPPSLSIARRLIDGWLREVETPTSDRATPAADEPTV